MMSVEAAEKYYSDCRKYAARYARLHRKTATVIDKIDEFVTIIDYINYNTKTGNVTVNSGLLSLGTCIYPTKLKRVVINEETICKLTNQRNELSRRWTKNHKGYYNRYS